MIYWWNKAKILTQRSFVPLPNTQARKLTTWLNGDVAPGALALCRKLPLESKSLDEVEFTLSTDRETSLCPLLAAAYASCEALTEF